MRNFCMIVSCKSEEKAQTALIQKIKKCTNLNNFILPLIFSFSIMNNLQGISFGVDKYSENSHFKKTFVLFKKCFLLFQVSVMLGSHVFKLLSRVTSVESFLRYSGQQKCFQSYLLVQLVSFSIIVSFLAGKYEALNNASWGEACQGKQCQTPGKSLLGSSQIFLQAERCCPVVLIMMGCLLATFWLSITILRLRPTSVKLLYWGL